MGDVVLLLSRGWPPKQPLYGKPVSHSLACGSQRGSDRKGEDQDRLSPQKVSQRGAGSSHSKETHYSFTFPQDFPWQRIHLKAHVLMWEEDLGSSSPFPHFQMGHRGPEPPLPVSRSQSHWPRSGARNSRIRSSRPEACCRFTLPGEFPLTFVLWAKWRIPVLA